MNRMDASEVAARYARFANVEVRGRSPLYEEIAWGVAADREVLGFLLTLPREKQQPNLLLAAVRHLCGTPADWGGFRGMLLANGLEWLRGLLSGTSRLERRRRVWSQNAVFIISLGLDPAQVLGACPIAAAQNLEPASAV